MEAKHKLANFKVGPLPTLIYVPDFISDTDQTFLLNNINGAPASKWKLLKNRRLQNWGGVVHEKGLLPQALPPWLTNLTQKIYEESGLFPSAINHVLINEYLPNQGIMPHQDGPAYFPVVAILSLGSPIVMDFTPHARLKLDSEDVIDKDLDGETSEIGKDKWLDDHCPFSILLMPRSLLIFKDKAYSGYLHGIKDCTVHSYDGAVNETEALKLIESDRHFSSSEDAVESIGKEENKNILRTSTRVSLTCRMVPKVHKNLFRVAMTLRTSAEFSLALTNLEGEVAYERADSRTDCKAMVRFNVSKDGVWKITKLELNHNHDFVPQEQRHLLRSMRGVSNAKGGLINSMVNAGMKVTNIWSYLGEEVGGFDNLGITMKDMHNYVYSEKLKLIDAGDAQALVNHLQSRQAQDAMFYYSVQLDQESRGSTSMEIGGCNNVSYHEVIFNHMPNKKYQVTFDSSTMMINCSCHKFDSMGILCSHALRIYNIKDSSSNVINSMTNGDDAGILYRNAIMKSFYNLVLETQEHKETQQIMWKLLNIGVEQVQQCIGKLNLNSNAETIENKFTQIEDNEWAAIFNPPLAKTKGMSTARKKGHFEKRKRSTTKTKQNKEKQKEDGFCAVNSSTIELTNVLNCMDKSAIL
ncbi:Zinc finger, PMZ-type [Sesbania bispinosa]|nr:Zinc finger, PMZ-type [Sesbania bispinosa]